MKILREEKPRFPKFNIAGRTLRSERGLSLVVVIMLMVIILAITGAGLLSSSVDLKVTSNHRAGTQAFYTADSGASAGFTQIGYSTATSIAPFTSTVNGMTYCSGTIATTGTNCATPQPLVALTPIPAITGCSLSSGAQVNAGGCILQPYQIDATGIGPIGATRQVQALATYGPIPQY
jgi:Tfp pilus assembly protein PilX